jgi:hypothetical protein
MRAAKTFERGKHLAVAPFEAGMKQSAAFLGNRHINESSVRVDRRIPSAESLVDADANEEGFHFSAGS